MYEKIIKCRLVLVALLTPGTGSPWHQALQQPLSAAPCPTHPGHSWHIQGPSGAAALLAGSVSVGFTAAGAAGVHLEERWGWGCKARKQAHLSGGRCVGAEEPRCPKGIGPLGCIISSLATRHLPSVPETQDTYQTSTVKQLVTANLLHPYPETTHGSHPLRTNISFPVSDTVFGFVSLWLFLFPRMFSFLPKSVSPELQFLWFQIKLFSYLQPSALGDRIVAIADTPIQKNLLVYLGYIRNGQCSFSKVKSIIKYLLTSGQFSCSVVSDSLWPHEPQHTRPPCPSPTPRVYPNSCPLSWWYHPTISSSVVPFSSCLKSFQVSGSFQMSQLFASGGQSIGVSASISVLPMNTQDWSPLGWTGWISLQSKGLSRVFNTTVQKPQFLCTQLSLRSNSHIHRWLLEKNIALTRWTFVGKVMSLLLNMLSRLVITFLPRSKRLLISWLHSPSAVILEPKKIISHCFHRFPIYLPWRDETGCHDLSFWNVEL